MSVGRSYFRFQLFGLLVPLAAVLIAGAWQMLGASGRIDVLSSAPLEVDVDGRPMVLQRDGRHWFGPVSRGTHAVRLRVERGDWETLTVEIHNGFDDILVPADSSQCFVVLLRSGLELQVLRRVPAHTPTAVAQGVAFGAEDLVAHPGATTVLIDVDCQSFALNDKDLIAQVTGP